MVKDFQPYFNLWTTIDEWNKKHDSWLNGKFDELDAAQLEEMVENSNKTLAQVSRVLRDKEQPEILKIAESKKQDVEAFKPYVPLALALRTEGMKTRHWEAVSEKVGFEVKPYENFTFQNCIDMGLPKHTEICVDVGDRAGKEYNIEC
jgi:dynein heavy chain